MKVSSSFGAALLAALTLLSPTLLSGQQAAPAATTPADVSEADPRAADEAAIRDSAAKYVAAFNAKNAKGLAALWSANAVTNDPLTDEEIVGPAAIEAAYAKFFAEPTAPKLEVAIESIEFLSPNVALELGSAQVISPDAEPMETAYSAVHVKQPEGWRLDRVSEEAPLEEPAPPPSNYERLKELGWLAGAWVDETEGAVVETRCHWSKNQNFLVRSFSLTVDDRIDVSGMQIIGWDGAAKKIRSWVFDSDGGFGEGLWTQSGARWTIEAKGTLADGSATTAVNILEKLDDDSFTWESVNRTAGGEVLPNVEKIRIVRVQPADGVDAASDVAAALAE